MLQCKTCLVCIFQNSIYRTLVVGIIIRKVREGIQQAVQSGTLLLFILLHKIHQLTVIFLFQPR